MTAKKIRSCFMANGMYLKANGELPCWDDVGEDKILRKLDPVALARGEEVELNSYQTLTHIRQSFSDGEYPYPDLCRSCAVHDACAPITEIFPKKLQVLHVEPSFLCHLNCPLCIPRKLRKKIKEPPYHLSAEMFEGFLRQLRNERVDQIELIVFEGRGDPLTAPEMEALVSLAKKYYPSSNTCITTHGSFPPKSWIAYSGLDVLRFSVDGAVQESLSQYRVGGKMDKILTFMRYVNETRKEAKSSLYIEWKYLLFEWNDSDEELVEAANLAEEVGARLRFCRTHSLGHSKKYKTACDVDEMIVRLKINASQDMTFQLKEDQDHAEVAAVRLEQIKGTFALAVEDFLADRQADALYHIGQVWKLEETNKLQAPEFSTLDDAAAYFLKNASGIRNAETAAGFAQFFNLVNQREFMIAALEQYLHVAPQGPQRDHVKADQAAQELVLAIEKENMEQAERTAVKIIRPETKEPQQLKDLIGPAMQLKHPSSLAAIAMLLEVRGELGGAISLLQRYIDLAPEAGDGLRVQEHIFYLKRKSRFVQFKSLLNLGSALIHKISRVSGNQNKSHSV